MLQHAVKVLEQTYSVMAMGIEHWPPELKADTDSQVHR